MPALEIIMRSFYLVMPSLVSGKKPQRDESPGKGSPEFSKTIHGGPAHRHRVELGAEELE